MDDRQKKLSCCSVFLQFRQIQSLATSQPQPQHWTITSACSLDFRWITISDEESWRSYQHSTCCTQLITLTQYTTGNRNVVLGPNAAQGKWTSSTIWMISCGWWWFAKDRGDIVQRMVVLGKGWWWTIKLGMAQFSGSAFWANFYRRVSHLTQLQLTHFIWGH